MTSARKKNVKTVFKEFVQRASQQPLNDPFLENLLRLTGQKTLKGMVNKFQKLAGIKPRPRKD